MAKSNSRKHARKVTLDAAVNNAIEKAVDARKVAAFTVGAAGVLAGAAFAFGATPAMAAEAGTAAETNPVPVEAKEKTGVDKKAEAGKNADAEPDAQSEAKETESNNAEDKDAAKQEKTGDKDQTDANKEAGDKAENTNKQAEQPVAKAENKKSDEENQKQEITTAGQDRASNNDANSSQIKPDTTDTTNTKINIDENNAGTMPNAYAWGSSDNTFSEDGEKHTVTFHFAAPKDGTITNIAIFPAQNNGLNNDKSRRGAEYYSSDATMRQNFSGTYEFTKNGDGSADLKMSNLFSKGTVNGGAEKYVASRSIFVYVTNKDGKEDVAYKTNVFRAVTLVPPKTSGSVVLKYNEQLTPEKVKAAITEAGNIETARSDKKSVNDQLSGKFTENINVDSSDPYDAKQFAAINTETSDKDAKDKTYVAGAKTLDTYMVTDLGFKSQAIPLTIARYDTRIEKPVVDEVDIKKLTDDQKADICKKLAQLNHVTQDKVKFNDQGQAVISFDGVDEKDAPKIDLKDLVIKNLKAGEYVVPSDDEGSTTKAVIISNPLGFTAAEETAIKKAIYDANKDNPALGLSSTDYEKQITLDWNRGNLTGSGTDNQGISNGDCENTIHVTIKTDKAIAKFDSDVKHNKLTRLVNLRTDYTLSWDSDKNKINGRDTDEGLAWTEDGKTLVYRYDSDSGTAFNTEDVLGLLKATIKDDLKQSNPQMRAELLGTEYKTVAHEGQKGNTTRSHTGYAVDAQGNPIGVLNLSKLNGSSYGRFSQPVSNSDKKMGDEQASVSDFTFDAESQTVQIAGKKDKYMLGRLFIEPYSQYHYNNIYGEGKYNLRNNPKGINIVFMPQTKHKTKDLSKSIDEHKTENVEGKDVPTQSKYYNASADKKKAYDDALAAAKETLKKVGTTADDKLSEDLKAEVDNATIKLNKARAELDGPDTIKDGLNTSIEADGTPAKEGTAATGTQATNQFKNVSDPDFKTPEGKSDEARNNAAKEAKKAYDKALEEAKKLKDDANATQKAVDDAKAKLDAAREKLNDFTTNKDELSAAIAKDGKVNTGEAGKTGDEKLKTADPTYQNSTPEQRKAYDDAVAEAQKVVADPNASQKEVNDAIKKLKEAKDALDKNATDKAPLDAAVQKSLDKDSNKHSVFYMNAKNKTGDSAAQQAVKNYDDALAEAKRVLGDKNATKADVDKAKRALEDAEKALYADTYATDSKSLAKALADNFSGYLMPAYFNAFDKAQAGDEQAKKDFKAYNDAYHAAKDLMDELNKPGSTIKQTDVDKVKQQLLDARKIIDTYATDTSRLSAAALNDVAIQNSPAYKNLKELAEKQNPTPEEQAEVNAAKNAKDAYDKAVEKLHKALANTLPRDKANGQDIPDSNIPVKDGDLNSKDYLKDIQAHKNGEPLNRDVDNILKEMNDAAKALDKFATKTDELIKSINKDSDTHPSPAFKNASQPSYKNDDGSDNTDKNRQAKEAADAYGKALNEAKDLLKDPTATQAKVDAAQKKLDEARKALDAYNTDITKLQESVAAHGTADVEGTKDSAAYRNASDPHFLKSDGNPDDDKNNQAKQAKADYDKALAEAQALIAKHNDANTPQDAKPMQAEIDAALAKLDAARKTLVGDIDDPKSGFGTDITDLEGEIHSSTPVGATDTIPGSVEGSITYKNALAKKGENGEENPDITRYKEALKKATELVEKQGSTKASERPLQKDVDDALQALKDAKKIINDGYKTDATALQDEAALGASDGNFTKSPEYKNAEAKSDNAELNAYKAALADVQTMLNNFGKDGKPKKNADEKDLPTQAEVDAALKNLSDARKAVEAQYKTKTDKLENEVGDKDETGQPVTPPFEASVPYKNALAKKNDGDTTATEKLKAYADKLAEAQKLIDQVNKPDLNAKPEDRPTQKQVDDALEALKKAKKDIDDAFATNAKALKDESAKSTADGGTVADVDFEATTEFKNADYEKGEGGKENTDVAAYKDALKKARTLLNKFDNDGKPNPGEKDIPSQKEVDDALQTLKKIKEKILANYKTSPVELQKEVDKSKEDGEGASIDGKFESTPAFKNVANNSSDAAKAALKDYNDKLAAAKKLLDAFDPATGGVKKQLPEGMTKAPTQKELDDALKALQAAKKKIEDDYSTSKSDLRTEAGDDFTKSPEYQNAQAKGDDASKQALEDYKNALDEANSVLADPNATQAEVDAALKRLQDAKSKLKAQNSTDKSKLQAEADDDANFRESVYFIIGNKADIEAYENALAEAKSVLADPNATQAQVDAALKKLEEAKKRILDFLSHFGGSGNGTGDWNGYGFVNGHESYGALVDKTALQIEVNNAVETSANTAEAVAYRQALAEARSVLNNPNATQAQVDAALRKLQAAKAALLNSLSGASGHKIAKTGAATGLFAGFAAIFAGLGAAGVASRRRKHSNE